MSCSTLASGSGSLIIRDFFSMRRGRQSCVPHENGKSAIVPTASSLVGGQPPHQFDGGGGGIRCISQFFLNITRPSLEDAFWRRMGAVLRYAVGHDVEGAHPGSLPGFKCSDRQVPFPVGLGQNISLTNIARGRRFHQGPRTQARVEAGDQPIADLAHAQGTSAGVEQEAQKRTMYLPYVHATLLRVHLQPRTGGMKGPPDAFCQVRRVISFYV